MKSLTFVLRIQETHVPALLVVDLVPALPVGVLPNQVNMVVGQKVDLIVDPGLVQIERT